MIDEAILNHEQLECLASPVRNDVFVRVRQLGAASARQVARELGKSSEAVHYHLKQLERAGLILEVARRPAPRKPESIYEPTARRLRLPGPDAAMEDRRLAQKTISNGLRDVIRGFEVASAIGENDPKADQRIRVIRANLCLSGDDFQEFLRLIDVANQFAQDHRSEDGERLQWSSVVFPVVISEASMDTADSRA